MVSPSEKKEIYEFARARNMSLLDLIRRGIQAEREKPTHIVIRAIKKKER
nr:MAG TPA: NikA, BACTERIAL CONJUGATION, RELAXASE, DNA [Caudoviricetes sp.]